MTSGLRSASRVIVLAALAAGVFLRLHDFTTQVVWHDEVVTLLRVAGHSRQEVGTILGVSGAPFSRDALLGLLTLPAESSPLSGAIDILRSSLTAPNLPAYYLLARLWSGAFSLSPASLRLFSTVLNFGAIAVLMLLCIRHLGGTVLSRYAATAALLSPYFIGYAREARSYSLLLLLLATTTLLFFEYRRSGSRWVLTALFGVMTTGALTHLLYLPCMAVHLLYFGWRAPNRARLEIAATALLSLLLASPWFMRIARTKEFSHHFTADDPIGGYTEGLILTASRLIVEPQSGVLTASVALPFAAVSLAVLLCAGVIAIRSDATRAPVLLWLAVPAGLVALDLLVGGQRALFLRYLFPAALAECVIVGWSLADRRKMIAPALGILLFLSSIGTYVGSSDPAWNRTPKIVKETVPVAAALDGAPEVPLFAAIPPVKILSIVNHLKRNRTIHPIGMKPPYNRVSNLPIEQEFFLLTEADDTPPTELRCSAVEHRGEALLLQRCKLGST